MKNSVLHLANTRECKPLCVMVFVSEVGTIDGGVQLELAGFK
jgi:hypothetical protein